MPHAQALVETTDPSTPAAALARRLRNRYETEWSAEAGFIKLEHGLCTFHSWPEGLRLDAFAETSDHLAGVEQFISGELGRENGLRVQWRRCAILQ